VKLTIETKELIIRFIIGAILTLAYLAGEYYMAVRLVMPGLAAAYTVLGLFILIFLLANLDRIELED